MQAIAKDNFSAAKQFNEHALAEAKKAKDDLIVKSILQRKAEIEAAGKDYEIARKAMATLETSPLDPDANLAVGRYYCLTKGDWERGVPMLSALGDDPVWKALGEHELKGAATPEVQAKLGDMWWNSAEATRGAAKQLMQERAGYWYQNPRLHWRASRSKKSLSRLHEIQEGLPVFLSDLPASEVRMWGPDQIDQDKLRFKGKFSSHNVWGHPPMDNSSSHRAYLLDGSFKILKGDVGIGAAKPPPGNPIVFRVVGDGRTLWQSRPLQLPGVSVPFQIAVTKIKKLELFVDCRGSHHSEWALWIDPRLER